jgi:(2R)-sulfolactate sulfo-lyase subunit alpha
MDSREGQTMISTTPSDEARTSGRLKPAFLFHHPEDAVGVAVQDLRAGMRATGRLLGGDEIRIVEVAEDIPLGHKLALRPISRGERVVEYGQVIGVASRDIAPGQHVHVHNLSSLRWA